MSGKHGVQLRGLDTTSSPLFQGRFGRMFRNLPAARFGTTDAENHDNLMKLGELTGRGDDTAKDGQDAEESGIPALYTYFGQFIDHDITFDPMSSLMKQNDPDALVDFRNPAFDLDNLYGRGPNDQPYMYEADGKHFLIPPDRLRGGDPQAADLARGPNGRALIGDPRNDENSIVSQLQGLFLRFHNRLADDNGDLGFEDVQRLVRRHYQYVLLNDFLVRIVNKDVLHELKTHGHFDRSKLRFFHWKNDPFLPVEFSVAAYRFGHSMVRPGYRLNDNILLTIFPDGKTENGKSPEGLTGFRPMNPEWGIDWGRFIDIDQRAYDGDENVQKKRLQFAYRMDTSLVDPLNKLPPAIVDPSDPPVSLAQRNLLRGRAFGLPSGQSVARAMGLKPLRDEKIIIGKAVDKPEDGDVVGPIVKVAGDAFAGNCPLWTYVLAEAASNKTDFRIPVKEDLSISTPQLGPVGGRIVAEVFLGLMFGDPGSLLSLDPYWVPSTGGGDPLPEFALRNLVKYVLGDGGKLGNGVA